MLQKCVMCADVLINIFQVMTTTVTFFIIILQFQKPIRQGSEDFSSTIVALNSTIRNLNNLIGELTMSQMSAFLPRENHTDNIHV